MTATVSSAPARGSLNEELFQVRNWHLLRAILNDISEGISIADVTGNFIYTSSYSDWLFGGGTSGLSPSQWGEERLAERPQLLFAGGRRNASEVFGKQRFEGVCPQVSKGWLRLSF